MSGARMPNCPASASKGFSSTPLKTSRGKAFHTPRDLYDGVLSDDEDTFSLLSPIYHDSFDSDEEALELSPVERTSPKPSGHSGLGTTPVRCELPKTPTERMSISDVQPEASPTLSAWEMWLVNKAKEDRLKMKKKVQEENLLKEKKQQQEKEEEQKKIVIEEKIQEWLKVKREQEKRDQFVKQVKEGEKIQRELEKQRETERKAQQKYKDWLQKKNHEKNEKEMKEKEEAAIKEEQEKERRKKAEETFKGWLAKANEKNRDVPRSTCYPTSPYNKSYPSPSFYNPIPWKPIHTPPPEPSPKQPSGMKTQKQRNSQQNQRTTLRLKNTVGAAQLVQRR